MRKANTVFSLPRYRLLIDEALGSTGYIKKADLAALVERRIGHRFSRWDLQRIPMCGGRFYLPRWRNQLAWTLVQLRHWGEVFTTGDWVVQFVHQPSNEMHAKLLQRALKRLPRPAPRGKKKGKYSIPSKVRRI